MAKKMTRKPGKKAARTPKKAGKKAKAKTRANAGLHPVKTETEKRGRGRPSGDTFTQAVADLICEKLSRGVFLAAICREEGMPGRMTVYDWLGSHPDFAVQVARAREVGYDALADQCAEIADDERHDWELSKKGIITNEVAIARARLRVDTRMRLLEKWDPKRYGKRIELDIPATGTKVLLPVPVPIPNAE